ncbi:hypothetical protein AB205_0112760 [Aquarana catesbeiana]|uniref:Uncharacterized protein n=1 Tax=Aquarana catesbeiana TaxID=8400 RepID=A0A2G9S9V5_AQUCT|nr:hypothetical protein AB205_0112760 [Aquarana catesbeiana]
MTYMSPGCGHTRACIFCQTRLNPGHHSLVFLRRFLPGCGSGVGGYSYSCHFYVEGGGEGPGFRAGYWARPPPGCHLPPPPPG